MASRIFSFADSLTFNEMKEKPQEKASTTEIIEVTSQINWVSARVFNFKEVITNRQNPSRFADVLKICCDVLFAIPIFYF